MEKAIIKTLLLYFIQRRIKQSTGYSVDIEAWRETKLKETYAFQVCYKEIRYWMTLLLIRMTDPI